MMKKGVTIVFLLSSIFMCQPVLAMDTAGSIDNVEHIEEVESVSPLASDYIGDYLGKLSHTGSSLKIEGYMAVLYADKL